jgi:hypothetical protein
MYQDRESNIAVQSVKEQTPELCLASFQQNGMALQCIKEQTF